MDAFWTVQGVYSGGGLSSTPTVKHATRGAAEAEAQRLAAKQVGTAFLVMAPVAAFKASPPVVSSIPLSALPSAGLPAPASDDGWIEWDGGGECPVPGDTIVDYRTRSGRVSRVPAAALHWRDEGSDFDIIAYRVVQP